MKEVCILVDWKAKHIIGAYLQLSEAQADYNKFKDGEDLQIITRDLIR